MSVLAVLIVSLNRGLFDPLDRLRAAARAVGGGDLSTRLRWRRRDELGQLADEFDAMAAGLEARQRSLEELAHRDPLTDLPNHRRFQEALAGEIDEARADGRPVAVVLLDVDDFKRINDARGHPHGDELLGGAASRLAAAMRDLGTVARVGRRRVRPRAPGRRRRARLRAGRGGPDRRRAVGSGARRAELLGGHRLLPGRREEHRRAAPARRRGARLGQGERPRAHAPLRPRARLRRDRGAARRLRGGDRPARGDPAGVPADRGADQRRGGRLRGAGALRRQARAAAVLVVLAGAPLRPRRRARGRVRARRARPPESPRAGPSCRST